MQIGTLGVVVRSNLNDVGADDLQSGETLKDLLDLLRDTDPVSMDDAHTMRLGAYSGSQTTNFGTD